jgi:hypothetical protein
VLTNFPPVPHAGLAAGESWIIPVTPAFNVVCPAFRTQGLQAGYQSHVYAVLEEAAGNAWVTVDRTKVYESEFSDSFPPNEGVTGQEGPRNFAQFTYLTRLELAGPANVAEGATAQFAARAVLSNATTNTVTPLWTLSPTRPGVQIDAAGNLTVLQLASNTSISVVATYTRSVDSASATQLVALVNVPQPSLVSWTNPASITFPTPLSAAQLNATGNVAGTFVYAPPAGTILPAGDDRPLTVTFTPSDLINYLPTNRTVFIDVLKAQQTLTFQPIPDKLEDDPPFMLFAFASSDLPVTFQVLSGPAQVQGEMLQITGVGAVTVRATQAGDNDYLAAPPAERGFTVREHRFNLTSPAISQGTFQCTLQGVPNRNYLLLVSDDLINWSVVSTNRADAAGAIPIRVPWIAGDTFKAYQCRSAP